MPRGTNKTAKDGSVQQKTTNTLFDMRKRYNLESVNNQKRLSGNSRDVKDRKTAQEGPISHCDKRSMHKRVQSKGWASRESYVGDRLSRGLNLLDNRFQRYRRREGGGGGGRF